MIGGVDGHLYGINKHTFFTHIYIINEKICLYLGMENLTDMKQ